MSSTNRSNARDSHVADYYVTPISEIKKFIEQFESDESINLKDLLTLDPCAGGDINHPMSYQTALGYPVQTLDIRPDSLAEIKEDYLTWKPDKEYQLIITNPPFNIAQSIIEKALEDVHPQGYVVMLLRLNYFGSKGRFNFWKNNMPKYAYVHHQRMSFTDGGVQTVSNICTVCGKKESK